MPTMFAIPRQDLSILLYERTGVQADVECYRDESKRCITYRVGEKTADLQNLEKLNYSEYMEKELELIIGMVTPVPPPQAPVLPLKTAPINLDLQRTIEL